jgi:hypothetical protein
MATNEDGVEIPNGEEVVGTGNDARLAMLARINDQVDVERSEHLRDIDDPDTGTTSEFVPPEIEAAAPEQVSEEQVVAEEAPAQPQEELYEIKVNGKTMQLTRDELIARAQKVEAADQYLQQAKQQVEAPAAPQPSPEDVARARQEEDLRLARAIQMGTEDEALAAIRSLRQSGPSVDDLTRVVDARLAQQEAYRQFQTTFKDIITNPTLDQMARARDQELLSQGDKRPYAERYQAIGEEIRKWVGELAASQGFKQPEPEAQSPTREAKVDAKRNMGQVPRPASGKPAAPEEERELTASEVIASIAASRGGPQWMMGQKGSA